MKPLAMGRSLKTAQEYWDSGVTTTMYEGIAIKDAIKRFARIKYGIRLSWTYIAEGEPLSFSATKNGMELKKGTYMMETVTEKALKKLAEDSSAEISEEEARSICLDLIDDLESDDKELADSVRLMIGLALPKITQEVMDEISPRLVIHDL